MFLTKHALCLGMRALNTGSFSFWKGPGHLPFCWDCSKFSVAKAKSGQNLNGKGRKSREKTQKEESVAQVLPNQT